MPGTSCEPEYDLSSPLPRAGAKPWARFRPVWAHHASPPARHLWTRMLPASTVPYSLAGRPCFADMVHVSKTDLNVSKLLKPAVLQTFDFRVC